MSLLYLQLSTNKHNHVLDRLIKFRYSLGWVLNKIRGCWGVHTYLIRASVEICICKVRTKLCILWNMFCNLSLDLIRLWYFLVRVLELWALKQNTVLTPEYFGFSYRSRCSSDNPIGVSNRVNRYVEWLVRIVFQTIVVHCLFQPLIVAVYLIRLVLQIRPLLLFLTGLANPAGFVHIQIQVEYIVSLKSYNSPNLSK